MITFHVNFFIHTTTNFTCIRVMIYPKCVCVCVCVCVHVYIYITESVSHSVMSDSLGPQGL